MGHLVFRAESFSSSFILPCVMSILNAAFLCLKYLIASWRPARLLSALTHINFVGTRLPAAPL